MELRPYQHEALNEIRQHFASGDKKVLLHLATGAGKTLIFCQVLKGVHEKGKRAMMVVRGKKLVDQASKRLEREGVDHGVIMAGHWRRRPSLPIQVCSIDTLYARRKKMDLPAFDLLVLDEAHYSGAASYHWLISHYPDAFYLPVTATPHLNLGMRHVADKVVYPIGIKTLMDQGYLVPPEYYSPSRPDLTDVKVDKKTGDYHLNQLSGAMERPNLFGDMVSSYQKLAMGLPALLFCVSVKHSLMVCHAFNAAGIKAEHLDANARDSQRDEVIGRLEAGETKVITNVGIFTTGVDIPCVQCIMLARPTKSYNLFIQIVGRGTRPYRGKDKFLVLDHANCLMEHGFIEDERPCDLDGTLPTEKKPRIKICQECFYVWDPSKFDACPACSWVPEKEEEPKERKALVDEGFELQKIEAHELMNKKVRALLTKAIARGYKVGWVYYKIKDDPALGEQFANKNFTQIKRMFSNMGGR